MEWRSMDRTPNREAVKPYIRHSIVVVVVTKLDREMSNYPPPTPKTRQVSKTSTSHQTRIPIHPGKKIIDLLVFFFRKCLPLSNSNKRVALLDMLTQMCQCP